MNETQAQKMGMKTTVLDNGQERVFSDPVTAVAEIYGVDRHELANAVVRLQCERILFRGENSAWQVEVSKK